MKKLGVNIDHIATLRQARGGRDPEPLYGALIVEHAGADGVVVHLREDRRHIQERDLRLLRQILSIPLNLEMAPVDEIVKIAVDVRPHTATLVPERREELTTEGGLDVRSNRDRIRDVVSALHDAGIEVSIFIDPDITQIETTHNIGVKKIEIHTGRYAEAVTPSEKKSTREEILKAALFARDMGLKVAAGHGLNYTNVSDIANIEVIEELNIGHSIISRAIFVGLERAVKEMKELIFRASTLAS